MKHLLQTSLLFLISYGIMVFITLEWNLTLWESYQRVCVLLVLAISLLIKTIIDTANTTLNDKSAIQDELIESYYENKKNKK